MNVSNAHVAIALFRFSPFVVAEHHLNGSHQQERVVELEYS